MKRSLLIVGLAAALGAAAHDVPARQGGHHSGRHSVHHGGAVRSAGVMSPAVSRGTARGTHSALMHPLPPGAAGFPRFRYYCPEFGRYYPDVPECPSGFRGFAE